MKRIFVFPAIALVVMFAFCSKKTGQITIAVIPKGTTQVFWKSVEAGALQAAQDLGVTAVWIGTEKEDDRQQQIALVDNQVMNGVSGIVLAPLDAMALRRPVESSVRKGIPVVIIDSDLADSESMTVSFVATDNAEGGRIAAREMAGFLDGKGRVVMLRFVEGSASTENRAAGFLEEIAKHPGIAIASQEQYGGATEAQSQQAAENLLLRFRDGKGAPTVDGIFCVNQGTTYGMLQALRRVRLAGKVTFIGFDSDEPFIEALKAGEMRGFVVQNPFRMGYLGVETMVKHLRGEPAEKRIDTGVTFISMENLDKPEVRELVHPRVEAVQEVITQSAKQVDNTISN